MNDHSVSVILLGVVLPVCASAADVRTIGIVTDGPGFDREEELTASDFEDRTLSWATQAYGTGLATQGALLDARNVSLNASLAWTDAAFVVLGDLLELERATSRQHARMEPAEWDGFLVELRAAAGAR